MPTPVTPAAPLDVNSLLNSLISKGLISDSSNTPQGSPKPPHNEDSNDGMRVSLGDKTISVEKKKPQEKLMDIPDVSDFNMNKLRMLHPGVIQRVYSGLQCTSCGLRFHSRDTARYSDHLDWHFKQNSKSQDGNKVAKCRQWYYPMPVSTSKNISMKCGKHVVFSIFGGYCCPVR